MHRMSIKHIAIAAGIVTSVVAVLSLLGIPWATILPLAVIAFCPVMMIAMMLMMGGHAGPSHDRHGAGDTPVHR